MGSENKRVNWCLSSEKMKNTLEVELFSGNKYKYRSTKQVNIGDVIVVERGYKSSGELGTVKRILSWNNTKAFNTASAVFSFTKDPTAEMLKNNASGIVELDSVKKIRKKTEIAKRGDFSYVDSSIENILNAITILAYPDLSTPQMMKKAQACLWTAKTVPAFLFGPEMKDVCSLGYLAFGSDIEEIICPRIIFTGYYPGWEEEFKSLSVWKKTEELGRIDIKKWRKRRISGVRDSLCFDKDEELLIGVPHKGFHEGFIEIVGCESKKHEALLSEDAEYNAFCNELIYRSALSILIKGGFVNLLEAALSAEMPILPFFDKLVEYADSIGSKECAKVLRDSNYKNKAFKNDKAKEKFAAMKAAKDAKKAAAAAMQFETRKWKGLLKLMRCNTDDPVIVVPEGVQFIKRYALGGKKMLRELYFPDSVTELEGGSCWSNDNLEKVVLSKNTTVIGEYCFHDCKKLTSINLEETKIETLPAKAFYECSSLTEIRLPKTLKRIDGAAFSLTGITKLVIPESVESIHLGSVFASWYTSEPVHLYFEGADKIIVGYSSSLESRDFFFHCKKGSKLWEKISEENRKIKEKRAQIPAEEIHDADYFLNNSSLDITGGQRQLIEGIKKQCEKNPDDFYFEYRYPYYNLIEL